MSHLHPSLILTALAVFTLASCSSPRSAREPADVRMESEAYDAAKHRGRKPAKKTTSSSTSTTNARVRVLYLVSADKKVDPRRRAVIEGAIKHVQKWYATKLGGSTFTLSDPVVEVARAQKPAAWFDSNPNGPDRDAWSYNNILAQASKVHGVRQGAPNTVWVIYSDSPDGGGRGGNGVAILPDHDLLGLLGEHPTEKNVDRWIGGLAHEIGHAFGLHHTEGKEHRDGALMQLGYTKYPETYLTELEKNTLWRSPFFSVTASNKSRHLATYTYAKGVFERRAMRTQTYWLERKSDGSAHFTFREIELTETHSIARDDWRGFVIKVPLEGGQSMLSMNDGKSWRPLYKLTCQDCTVTKSD